MTARRIVFAALLVASPAAAENEAEKLYKRGAAEMNAGRVSAACPLFAKSYDTERSLGVLYALAECEAKDGQSAAALEHFRRYKEAVAAAPAQEQASESARTKSAEARIEALERTVPELAITDVPDGAIVRVDGSVVPFLEHVLVEPGDHVVVVEVRDGPKIGHKVTVAAGEHTRVSVALPVEKPAAPPERPHGAPEPRRLALEPASAPPPRPPPSLPPTAWIIATGAIGVAGLTAGTILGVMAMERADVVDKHCFDVLCDHEGKRAADQGKALGWASTAAFAAGVVGVGAAIVLFATGGSADKSARAWRPIVAASELGVWRW